MYDMFCTPPFIFIASILISLILDVGFVLYLTDVRGEKTEFENFT
jgi:hypothetical protein